MKEQSILHGLVLFFLREKNRIIKENCGIDMFNDGDYDEVCHWPEEKVLDFLLNLKEERFSSDTSICPWCVFYHTLKRDTCTGCEYMERHGQCITIFDNHGGSVSILINPESTYGKITIELKRKHFGSIARDDEIQNLVELTIEIFDKIILNTDRSYEEIIKILSRLVTFVDVQVRREEHAV